MANRSKLKPGSPFLSRKAKSGRNRTGIVKKTEDNSIDTGLGKGPEICKRIRNYKNKDFIVIQSSKSYS